MHFKCRGSPYIVHFKCRDPPFIVCFKQWTWHRDRILKLHFQLLWFLVQDKRLSLHLFYSFCHWTPCSIVKLVRLTFFSFLKPIFNIILNRSLNDFPDRIKFFQLYLQIWRCNLLSFLSIWVFRIQAFITGRSISTIIISLCSCYTWGFFTLIKQKFCSKTSCLNNIYIFTY